MRFNNNYKSHDVDIPLFFTIIIVQLTCTEKRAS